MKSSLGYLIRRTLLRRPQAVIDVTVLLWEKLAAEIVSLIGDAGFQSIYFRSGVLAASHYPWMILNSSLKQAELQFAGLRNSLEGRNLAEISEASVVLLTTFLEILASLIGEFLMIKLLQTAWGDDVLTPVDKNKVSW